MRNRGTPVVRDQSRYAELDEPVIVSKELARIVGRGPHTRTSLTRRLWKYIGERDLIVRREPPMAVRPDAALASVVGTQSTLDMYEIADLVNLHLRPARTVSNASPKLKQRRRQPENRGSASPGHWLWVTKPEFHQKVDGSSAIRVGPQEGWWTCSRATKAGDLILMYRARTRKDIAYLILATTDAFSILDDPFAQEYGWEWACEYDVLYEFDDPIPLSALRANKEFWDWSPLRINFQGRVFEVTEPYWRRLIQLALPSNRALAKFVGIEPGFSAPARIGAERELEDSLVKDLGKLRKVGWDLELWQDPVTGRSGRQFVCAAAGGRIDLLCRDRTSGHLVIVELKNVLATEDTYMQTWRYVSWVQGVMAGGKPVSGLVVARGYDSRFKLMADASDRKVRFLSLKDAGFE